jgi:glycosyltransferase involved in cell wall biosynthesis
MKKILIATDAWYPQVNGVVRTLNTTAEELKKLGFEVVFLTPNNFRNFRWPFYKEISISIPDKKVIESLFSKECAPDYVHVATEGTIGLMVRNYCLKHKISFTTSYHTRFPEYLKKMHCIPLGITYAYLRWFHSKASRVLVPTRSMKEILGKKRFKNVVVWPRGVDLSVFKPYSKSSNLKRPIVAYVGRVSAEKNMMAFVDLKTEGTKIVIGDGPICSRLQKENSDIHFFGVKTGEELARLYSESDVFVFPSKSDTYGLVLLESLACGVPFAAYPEPGPIDIAKTSPELAKRSCFIGEDLQQCLDNAIKFGNSKDAIELAKIFSWENCTTTFTDYLIGVK